MTVKSIRTLTGVLLAGPAGEGLLTDAFLARTLGRVAACTEDELLARARELLIRTQRERPQCQQAGVTAIDILLTEARRRGGPDLLGALLRYAVVIRLISRTPLTQADPLIEELARLAGRYGMTLLQADAHALRARRSVLAGADEAALTDAATALALLADPEAPKGQAGPQWDHALAATLTDLGLVLTSLGVHELADDVLKRAERHLRVSAGPVELLVNGLNRLRLLVSWGLRLERAGHREQAVERYVGAQQVARAVEPLWMRTMFNSGDRSAADQCPLLAAAIALAGPGPAHVDRLRLLSQIAILTSERIIVGIALGRCLERCGLTAAALTALTTTRNGLVDDPPRAEPMLQLALSRELARLQDAMAPAVPGGQAIRDYACALEAEMWSLREARLAAMRSQADHLQLARKHGTVTALALSDPLTGLPNRRALDEQLRQTLNNPTGLPCSVAVVDLDGFKDVNDKYSHGTGDDVLRTVADALRGALRADDTVARYGGDEFVVLLPATTLTAAAGALERAVRAVAGLTEQAGGGVTLSAGVVAAGDQDDAESVLARADSAMYQAKRRGGNQVNVEDDQVNGADGPGARRRSPRGAGRAVESRPVPPPTDCAEIGRS